jgi:hypothetical protein
MSKKLLNILLIFLISLVISVLILPSLFNAPLLSQASSESQLISYTIPKKFSLLLPTDLVPQNKIANDVNYFSFTNYQQELPPGELAPREAIETEITFNQKNIDVILQTRYQQATQYQEVVTKEGELKIDGQKAIRVWYEGGDWNFPNEISSYIPYNDQQTVVISSYYSPDNPNAVDIIERIHWSFRRLD